MNRQEFEAWRAGIYAQISEAEGIIGLSQINRGGVGQHNNRTPEEVKRVNDKRDSLREKVANAYNKTKEVVGKVAHAGAEAVRNTAQKASEKVSQVKAKLANMGNDNRPIGLAGLDRTKTAPTGTATPSKKPDAPQKKPQPAPSNKSTSAPSNMAKNFGSAIKQGGDNKTTGNTAGGQKQTNTSSAGAKTETKAETHTGKAKRDDQPIGLAGIKDKDDDKAKEKEKVANDLKSKAKDFRGKSAGEKVAEMGKKAFWGAANAYHGAKAMGKAIGQWAKRANELAEKRQNKKWGVKSDETDTKAKNSASNKSDDNGTSNNSNTKGTSQTVRSNGGSGNGGTHVHIHVNGGGSNSSDGDLKTKVKQAKEKAKSSSDDTITADPSIHQAREEAYKARRAEEKAKNQEEHENFFKKVNGQKVTPKAPENTKEKDKDTTTAKTVGAVGKEIAKVVKADKDKKKDVKEKTPQKIGKQKEQSPEGKAELANKVKDAKEKFQKTSDINRAKKKQYEESQAKGKNAQTNVEKHRELTQDISRLAQKERTDADATGAKEASINAAKKGYKYIFDREKNREDVKSDLKDRLAKYKEEKAKGEGAKEETKAETQTAKAEVKEAPKTQPKVKEETKVKAETKTETAKGETKAGETEDKEPAKEPTKAEKLKATTPQKKEVKIKKNPNESNYRKLTTDEVQNAEAKKLPAGDAKGSHTLQHVKTKGDEASMYDDEKGNPVPAKVSDVKKDNTGERTERKAIVIKKNGKTVREVKPEDKAEAGKPDDNKGGDKPTEPKKEETKVEVKTEPKAVAGGNGDDGKQPDDNGSKEPKKAEPKAETKQAITAVAGGQTPPPNGDGGDDDKKKQPKKAEKKETTEEPTSQVGTMVAGGQTPPPNGDDDKDPNKKGGDKDKKKDPNGKGKDAKEGTATEGGMPKQENFKNWAEYNKAKKEWMAKNPDHPDTKAYQKKLAETHANLAAKRAEEDKQKSAEREAKMGKAGHEKSAEEIKAHNAQVRKENGQSELNDDEKVMDTKKQENTVSSEWRKDFINRTKKGDTKDLPDDVKNLMTKYQNYYKRVDKGEPLTKATDDNRYVHTDLGKEGENLELELRKVMQDHPEAFGKKTTVKDGEKESKKPSAPKKIDLKGLLAKKHAEKQDGDNDDNIVDKFIAHATGDDEEGPSDAELKAIAKKQTLAALKKKHQNK